jgi:hypothetical protein
LLNLNWWRLEISLKRVMKTMRFEHTHCVM